MDKLLGKCQCDKLQRQLKRYETKFSDLVGSYKTIIEEKRVLEETLKTLSASSTDEKSTGDDCSEYDVKTNKEGTADVLEDTNGSPPGSSSEKNPDGSQIKLLEEKISMLSKALNSVNEGKAKMESAFKNDRKSIIAEHSNVLEIINKEKEDAIKSEEEMRSKLCLEQLAREDESKAHVLMLKELQEILAEERREKDVLKLILQEKDLSCDRQGQSQESNAESMEAIITSQMDAHTIDDSEENERAEADQQQYQFDFEQLRGDHVEDILAERQLQEERRIVELESRLSELSAVVGNYDRKRQEDLQVIKKLRERLENMEKENSELVSRDSGASFSSKAEILISNSLNTSIDSTDSLHQACHEEYKQLLDEFDLYKRKSKYRLPKDKSSDEVVECKKKICWLEKEIDKLKVYHDEKERTNLRIISGLQIEATRLKEDYERRVENINQDCKLNIEQMECELRKQRIRTMEVIADRDKEIERLQNKLYEYEDPPRNSSSPNNSTNLCVNEKSVISKNEDLALVNEIIVNSPSNMGSDGLFYFTQQVAHYDAELYTCRMQILDLESQVRDFEKKEEQLLVQMQALKEEIRNLERGKSRESANLEYLKNICLKYMLTDSTSVKSQMSQAISTVLSFSPEEISQVQKRQKSGWW